MARWHGLAVIGTVLVLLIPGCSSSSAGRAPAPTSQPTPAYKPTNWLNMPVPGGFCSVPGVVKIVNGSAVAMSTRLGRVHFDADGSRVVYGSLLGEGTTTAAVNVWCDRGTGTADGQLAEEYVVFSYKTKSSKMIRVDVVTAQKQSLPGLHVAFISDFELYKNVAIVRAVWYSTDDPTCCPSGRALTTWYFNKGSFLAGTTIVP